MLKKIKSTLSDDNGNLSSMRILTTLIIVVFLFNWTYYNITQGKLAPFGWAEMSTMVGALCAKAWQKDKEY